MECEELKLKGCVCDIVKTIARKQREIERRNSVGCEASLNELSKRVNLFNTIPLLFVCKDCEYYIAAGVFRDRETMAFNCIQTPVFRVDHIIDDTCCAQLELLQAQTSTGTVTVSNESGVCRFFPTNTITRFIRTGIFVTIDLNCFCGVECLPAVNAQRGTPQFPPEVCTNPMITLTVSPTITCAGEVSGTVTCNGEPVENAVVILSSDGSATVNFETNPVLTNASGNFSTIITIPSGTLPTAVTITAQTTVNGITVMDTAPTLVSCPSTPGSPCGGCGILIVDGPTTTAATIVSNGVPSEVTGDINLTINECNNCGNSDNFNFTFNLDHTTLNFTQGRRTTITCTPGETATINGVIKVQGNNPYFDNGEVFNVTITATAPGVYTIDAISGTDEFHASYTGENTSQFEIRDCTAA